MKPNFKVLYSTAAVLSACTFLAGLLLFGTCTVHAQGPARVIEIEKAVRQSMAEIPQMEVPLLVTPVSNLSEDVIGVQMPSSKFRATRVLVLDFYEVHPALYLMDGDKVIGENIDLGEDRHWLIGFGPTNSMYLLAGFDDPVSGFNRLISDLALGTVTQDSVMDVFDLFLKAAYGNQFRASLVADEMHLQSLAIEDFRLRYPTTRRKSEYEKWWARVPRSLRKSLSFPEVLPDKGGFKISYFRYESGRVLQETVLVSPQGTVVRGSSAVRYSQPKTDPTSNHKVRQIRPGQTRHHRTK